MVINGIKICIEILRIQLVQKELNKKKEKGDTLWMSGIRLDCYFQKYTLKHFRSIHWIIISEVYKKALIMSLENKNYFKQILDKY